MLDSPEVENNRDILRQIRSTCDPIASPRPVIISSRADCSLDNFLPTSCCSKTPYNRLLALGKAASNQSTADSCSDYSMHESFDESCSPPPSWENVDMMSSVINTPIQCPVGDISSFPVSETEDFLIPSSASVVEGLGAGISIVSRSTSTKAKAKAKAIASVDKKLTNSISAVRSQFLNGVDLFYGPWG